MDCGSFVFRTSGATSASDFQDPFIAFSLINQGEHLSKRGIFALPVESKRSKEI
jgi:hypothetical protein